MTSRLSFAGHLPAKNTTEVQEFSDSDYLARNQTIEETFSSCETALESRRKLRDEYWEWVNKLGSLKSTIESILAGIYSPHFEAERTYEQATEFLIEIQCLFSDTNSNMNEEWFGTKCGGDLIDHYNGLLAQLSKYCVILCYLKSEAFATRDDVANMLGLSLNDTNVFALNAHVYFDGVLGICDPLVRFATLGVGLGFFSRPIVVGEFLNKVFQGFVSIEKKDDKLRGKMRHFESELRKLEQVMFEVSVRNLVKPS